MWAFSALGRGQGGGHRLEGGRYPGHIQGQLAKYIHCVVSVFLREDLTPLGFPGGTSSKEPACQCRLDMRDMGMIPGLGRSPGTGHGNPLQYSCLENSMDRGAWQAAVHGVAESRTQLSDLMTEYLIGVLNAVDLKQST